MTDFEKQNIKIIDRVQGKYRNTRTKGKEGRLYKDCPVCGKHDHFWVFSEENKFFSLANCCKGGDIVDFLELVEGFSRSDAMKLVEGNAINTSKRCLVIKKPILTDKQILNHYYDKYVKEYKKAKSLYSANNSHENRLKLDFYDMLTNYFVEKDWYDVKDNKFLFDCCKYEKELYNKYVTIPKIIVSKIEKGIENAIKELEKDQDILDNLEKFNIEFKSELININNNNKKQIKRGK